MGTGGASHYAIGQPLVQAQAYSDHTFGVLEPTLNSSSYDWKFVPVAGKTFTEVGKGSCHLVRRIRTQEADTVPLFLPIIYPSVWKTKSPRYVSRMAHILDVPSL